MSFVVRKSQSRPWPVTVVLHVGDADGNVAEVKQGFVLNFKPLSEKEAQKIIDAETPAEFKVSPLKVLDAESDEALTEALTPRRPTVEEMLDINARVFPRLVDGWSQLLDESGNPVPYSADALAAMITGPDGMAISTGINQARMQMTYGVAPEKNVATSPAPGPEAGADEAAAETK